MLKTKWINKEPIFQSKSKKNEPNKITPPLIINIVSLVAFILSLLLFMLAFLFLHLLHFDKIFKELYYSTIVLLAFSGVMFIIHLVYFFIKNKTVMRKIEIPTCGLYTILVLIYAIIQFSVGRQVYVKSFYFWVDEKNFIPYINEYESKLKCCGYQSNLSRCIWDGKRHLPNCPNAIRKKFLTQQTPLASCQLFLAICLFGFLFILVLRALYYRKKNKKNKMKLNGMSEKDERKQELIGYDDL